MCFCCEPVVKQPMKTATDYLFDEKLLVDFLVELKRVHPRGYDFSNRDVASWQIMSLKNCGLIELGDHTGLQTCIRITKLGIKELNARFPNTIKEAK